MTKIFDFSTIKERNIIWLKKKIQTLLTMAIATKTRDKDNDNDDAKFYYENTYKLYG